MMQALYLIDTSSQTYVEECINWQEKNTLIVSLYSVPSSLQRYCQQQILTIETSLSSFEIF